jgi:ATP-binding cassette subfamily C (CFTR/MRP) protein 1
VWYKTVIHACALETEALQWHDESTIGSKGLSLSGGQKQRVVC